MASDADILKTLPDGLGHRHLEPDRGVRRHASILSLLILGLIVGLALGGVLGGGPNARLTTDTDRVTLTYDGPTTIRNGMFFEAHALVRAKAPIGKLVLAVDESLVHDLTMNSMVPSAGEESFKDGAFRFTYDRLGAGDVFDIKFDFQINPSLFAGNDGRIAVYDDETLLAELPVTITVLP